MLETPSSLLVMLLLTHVVADFILPFKRVMASPTFCSRWLGLRALACLHGLAVFLLLALARPSVANAALAGLAVAVSWLAASQLIPRLSRQSIVKLLLEHATHTAILVGIWLTCEGYWAQVGGFIGQRLSTRNLLILLAYLLVLRPASALIARGIKAMAACGQPTRLTTKCRSAHRLSGAHADLDLCAAGSMGSRRFFAHSQEHSAFYRNSEC